MQIPTPELYYQLLPTHHVAIHARRGVKIRGLWYDGPALKPYRDAPSTRGGQHKGKWVVRRDPRDARFVFFPGRRRRWSRHDLLTATTPVRVHRIHAVPQLGGPPFDRVVPAASDRETATGWARWRTTRHAFMPAPRLTAGEYGRLGPRRRSLYDLHRAATHAGWRIYWRWRPATGAVIRCGPAAPPARAGAVEGRPAAWAAGPDPPPAAATTCSTAGIQDG